MLLEQVDFFRLDAGRRLDSSRKSELGQFMTPAAVARLMASMFEGKQRDISLLDPGAGVGSLTAAFVSEICSREQRPRRIEVTAYEIDDSLVEYLSETLRQCGKVCELAGVEFHSVLLQKNFIEDGARMLRDRMFASLQRFNCIITNPPYKKIHSDSEARLLLREIDVETSNLYTGFLSVALKLLADDGELVAITPRSFCNGPYFKPFRKLLLEMLTLRRVHVFESRQIAFQEDAVLQENIIFHGVKAHTDGTVTIASSESPDDDLIAERTIPYSQLVNRNDPNYFIRLVVDELDASVARDMRSLGTTLPELQIEVSTGRVVDFRATRFLRSDVEAGTAPLIYPRHLENGFVSWPKAGGNKAHAIALVPGADELLVPKGAYVLVKRFSAKEEVRRVVSAVYDPGRIKAERVGFENHLNYFHREGGGLPLVLAKGMAAFLNSSMVDLYFRQFNGHTQVNATDLRSLKYPSAKQLESLGARIQDVFPDQHELDEMIREELFDLGYSKNAVKARRRIDEALSVLKDLCVPGEQQNERSALTLLALLEIKPNTPWPAAKAPLMGITPLMNFFEEHYGKRYAPNTRETVRRQTIHQFLDGGIVVINPDDPSRPTNSRYAVYQIESGLLELLKTYNTPGWEKGLQTYLASVESLKSRYAQERKMKRIPIQVARGKSITLSPGGQNILVERIIKDFCETFAAGSALVYVGDTDEKWAYYDKSLLESLGVGIETHGKMPDVIVYMKKRNWLILIEAVTSHGPVNPKRRGELKTLFKDSKAGLVFVTAFLDRRTMTKYLSEISWETEVWVADAPSHLIHFNGERFLGPYEE